MRIENLAVCVQFPIPSNQLAYAGCTAIGRYKQFILAYMYEYERQRARERAIIFGAAFLSSFFDAFSWSTYTFKWK